MIWLLAPFLSAVAIGSTPALRRLIARFYLPCLLIGWAGLGLMAASLLALDGTLETLGPAVGGVLGGFSMWGRRGGGGGWDDPPEHDPEPPPGGDWETFERDFRRWEAEQRRPVPVA
jgi:hypothetical protein